MRQLVQSVPKHGPSRPIKYWQHVDGSVANCTRVHFPGRATEVQMIVCSFQIQVIVVIFKTFISEEKYSHWFFTICIYL